MLDEIRRIAQGVVDSNTFLALYTGEVRKIDPITVRVDGLGIDISGSQLNVPHYLVELNVLNDIKPGNAVVLLGPVNGNQYYMMDIQTG